MYIEATPVVGGGAQLSQTEKIRRKIGYEKVVKSTDHINAYYVNLTNFEYEGNEMNGNGNYFNVLELTWKKS